MFFQGIELVMDSEFDMRWFDWQHDQDARLYGCVEWRPLPESVH